MSIAHDETDGAWVYVLTDRPVVRVGSPSTLPLAIESTGGGRLSVTATQQTLPAKVRMRLSGAVPHGAAWSWAAQGTGGAGGADPFDPVTNNPLNAAAGDCADVPGPCVTPPAASVISAELIGVNCTLPFDRPVNLVIGATPDDAVTFDGIAPVAVVQRTPTLLTFTPAAPLSSGSVWAIARQPAWVDSPVDAPQAGSF